MGLGAWDCQKCRFQSELSVVGGWWWVVGGWVGGAQTHFMVGPGRGPTKTTIKKNNNDHIQMWKIYIYVADLTIASMGNTLEQHRMQIGRFHSRGLKISRKKIKIPLKERSLSFLGTSVLVLFLVNWLIGSAASGVQVGRGSDWGLPDSSPPSSTTCLVGFEKVRHLI